MHSRNFGLQEDAINVEAIACIGMNHFYADQPELSLRFYRRLLQMGINNAELFNNLGLCCFYAQQYDMTLACMERALSLATEETIGEMRLRIRVMTPSAISITVLFSSRRQFNAVPYYF